ncbi:MAG: ATP-binding domain-containing protein, partial [Bacteroidetes bacterium]|nr:ATP-binding domain-containing protein [Bacteroidota bacterium]
EVWTSNGQGEKIKLIRAISDNEEGKLIAENIFEEKMRNQMSNNEFAILYRTNSQSRSFEEALRKINIPYKVIGGMSFYQRKEIKDLIAYLRLVVNNNDEEALKRIINYPARGIGDTSVNRLIAIADREDKTLWHIIDNCELYPELKSASKNFSDFRDLIRSFIAINKHKNAYETAMHVAKNSGILKVMYDDKSVEGTARYENIEELLSGIEQFVEEDEITMLDDAPTEKNLANYLQNISLLTDQDKEDTEIDRVQMMTIHASKGLEFNNLFVVGLEENLFPSQMSLSSRSDLEEERRLFYVAVTRAMKKLTLSFATTRFKFGNLQHCEPSRFLNEIDPQLIDIAVSIKNPFDSDDSSSGWRQPSFGRGFGGFEKKSSPPPEVKKGTPGGFKGNPPINNPIGKIIPKNAKPPIIADFTPDDTSNLASGMRIEHQRFGGGVVTAIEGKADERKATIVFDEYGEKKVILKFAKLRLLN